MFECKYKYELEDSLTSARYVYRSQKRTKDKVIAIMIPIMLVVMVALLVVDIVNKKSYVLDIVLIACLAVLQVLYLLIPVSLNRAQKKSFYGQHLDEMDELAVTIDNTTCTEVLMKDGKEFAKNLHSLKSLTSYLEDDNRLILVFNSAEYVCLRKANIVGDIDQLKTLLQKAMAKGKKK